MGLDRKQTIRELSSIREELTMDNEEIKEILEKQFKLLSKRLESELDSYAICKISKEMRQVAEFLMDAFL